MKLASLRVLAVALLAMIPAVDSLASITSSPFASNETFTYAFPSNSVVATSSGQQWLAASNYDTAASGVSSLNSGISGNAAFMDADFTGPSFQEYHEFSVGPTPVNWPTGSVYTTEMCFQSVSFDHVVTNPGFASYAVRLTAQHSGGTFVSSTFATTATTTTRTVSLASLGVLIDETVTFRIWFQDTANGTPARQFVDNISINAQAIPEPASMVALVAFGMVGFARRRRK